MRTITKRAYVLYALVAFFFIGLVILMYTFTVNASDWALNHANRHIFDGNTLTVAGTIYDKNGKTLVQTVDSKRIYNENLTTRLSTLHVIGDSSGYISSGIQTIYSDDLIGYNFLNGVHSISTTGGGNNIRLTLDADVTNAALKALNGRKGSVSVYNYKTGEIICMVTAPTYDPENKPKDIETNTTGKYEGLYLNRTISGVFTPGSIFKVFTTASAIENIPGIEDRTYQCDGVYEVPGGGEVRCHEVHGKLTFQGALTYSCNWAFAEMSVLIGADALTATMNKAGFNASFQMGRTPVATSTFDLSGTYNIDIGWAGIGQYKTLANPFHIMLAMGSVANGGTSPLPYVVSKIETPTGRAVFKASSKNAPTFFNLPTANRLSTMMRNSVKDYYRDSTFPNLQLAGKTGTAEVIGEKPHAWFVGFSTREDFPYAFAVVVQNGGGGYQEAMPVANAVMQAALKSVVG